MCGVVIWAFSISLKTSPGIDIQRQKRYSWCCARGDPGLQHLTENISENWCWNSLNLDMFLHKSFDVQRKLCLISKQIDENFNKSKQSGIGSRNSWRSTFVCDFCVKNELSWPKLLKNYSDKSHGKFILIKNKPYEAFSRRMKNVFNFFVIQNWLERFGPTEWITNSLMCLHLVRRYSRLRKKGRWLKRLLMHEKSKCFKKA